MVNKTIQRKTGRPRIVSGDSEIDRAIASARRLQGEPLVKEVEYRSGPGLDLLVLKLSDGRRQVIPREDLQGLSSASRDQISRIEVLGGGTGLHWPDLNVDLYVPALLRGTYGDRKWMAKIGRRGGLARSPTKKRASRANGKLGGRPRKHELSAGA